jgi:nucleoside-diphosphate-sugar epimerase
MKVFVVGGTGAIGGWAVPALVRAGLEVTALARTTEKAARLRRQGAAAVMTSIFDRAALPAAFNGHQVVVNLTSAIPAMSRFMQTNAWAANDRVRTEGSAAIVDAALAAGVTRVVQESVGMLYRDRGGRWIEEDWPTDHYPIARANHAAEASARRISAAGGAGVVLRFGWFYGPGARHSEEFLEVARRRVCMMMGPPERYVSSLHVADAGAAVVAALTVPAGTYNIVDDEPLTKRAYADALAAAAGRRVFLRVPGRLALLLGDRSTSLTRSLRVSNARVRATSGWAPAYTSAREGLLATATALEQRRAQPHPAAV